MDIEADSDLFRVPAMAALNNSGFIKIFQRLLIKSL